MIYGACLLLQALPGTLFTTPTRHNYTETPAGLGLCCLFLPPQPPPNPILVLIPQTNLPCDNLTKGCDPRANGCHMVQRSLDTRLLPSRRDSRLLRAR